MPQDECGNMLILSQNDRMLSFLRHSRIPQSSSNSQKTVLTDRIQFIQLAFSFYFWNVKTTEQQFPSRTAAVDNATIAASASFRSSKVRFGTITEPVRFWSSFSIFLEFCRVWKMSNQSMSSICCIWHFIYNGAIYTHVSLYPRIIRFKSRIKYLYWPFFHWFPQTTWSIDPFSVF